MFQLIGSLMTKQTKVIVTAALMLGMFLAALDATIVSTAMPSIVGKLGGITLYSWVFSAYLLTSTTTVPIYGKLADLYGRKPILLLGSALFLIGSITAGMAQNMEQLIAFRALQGLGAGAVQPIVITIVGDIFSLQERAKIQGLFSGVWGLSSLVGPALGGLIVDHADWRWVFYINVPFGLLSILLIALFFKEQIEQKKHSIDYIGALTLSGTIVALLFALLQGGTSWAWNSPQSITLFATSAVLLVLFIAQEARTAEPVLPVTLFKNRVISIANIGNLMLGIIMFGVSSYIPLFIQGARGGSATNAGLILMPYLIAWSITATFSAGLIIRYNYRFTAMFGSILSASGTAMMIFYRSETNLFFILVSMFLIGAGFGLTSTTFTLSVQNAVAWNLRGVATASGQFFRTIGGTVGVALMGTILNSQMAQHFAPIFDSFKSVVATLPRGIDKANILLTPSVRDRLPLEFVHQLQVALSQSLLWIYILLFSFAMIGLLAMFWLPGKTSEKAAYQPEKETLATSK